MITYGAVVGGPECSFFREVYSSTPGLTEEQRKKLEIDRECLSKPVVNVVFHLPGSLIRPDFDGMRTAKFSKKQKVLMIQVSVTEDIIQSRDKTEVIEYILKSTKSALSLAKQKFAKSKILYDTEEDIQTIETWHKRTLSS